MREIAERDAAHPAVRYLEGRAELIPLPGGCCDAALLFMSLHHIEKHAVAFAELARVIRPAGTLLIRCEFAGRMHDLPVYRYFPALRMAHPPARRVEDLVADANAFGFDLVTLDAFCVEPGRTLRDLHSRVRELLAAHPALVSREEAAAGLAAMARDVVVEGDRPLRPSTGDLLVLRRSKL